MSQRKTILIGLSLLLGLFYLNCSPYLMKAKMAKRDRRYDLALDYALKHFNRHQNDPGAARFLQEVAFLYYDATKARIQSLERSEDWDREVEVSKVAYAKLSRLAGIKALTFPTKKELNFLKSKAEISNIRRTEEVYLEGKRYFQAKQYEEALAKFTQCREYVPHYRDIDDLIATCKTNLAEAQYQKGLERFNVKDYAAALQYFEQSLQYVENYKDAADYIRKSKEGLAAESYRQGQKLMREGNYEQAIRKFEQSIGYIPDFLDANAQIQRAKEILASQNYNKGLDYMRAGRYNLALQSFQKALNYKSDYPDAKEKYEEVKELLTVRVAVFPFRTLNLNRSFGDIVSQQVVSKALPKKTEFLVFVDRENLERVLREQALGQTGAIDEKTAVQVGKLTGVNVIMTGTVSLVSYQEPRVIRRVKTASYYKYYLDPKGIKRKKAIPFSYTSYEKKRSVNVSVSYRLTDVETGQILESKTLSSTRSDAAIWVICPKERVRDLPSEDRKRLSASREPKSREVLIGEAIDELTSRITASFLARVRSFKRR